MGICKVEGCNRLGHGHHIVYRGHGGLDIPMNIMDLCYEHHNMGNRCPHKCREIDLEYKIELQRKYFNLFREQMYTIEEITELLDCHSKKLKEQVRKKFKTVKQCGGKYFKEDIIRALMGGKLF